MHLRIFPISKALLLSGSLLLGACNSTEPGINTAATDTPAPPTAAAAAPLASERWHTNIDAEYWHLLPAGSRADHAAANTKGLWLLDAAGQTIASLPGRFASLDSRLHAGQLLLASVDADHEQALLLGMPVTATTLSEHLRLPASRYKVESLCLYTDDANNLHLFLIGEEGLGDQWLVADTDGPLNQARHVRRLSLPPQSTFCAVDDQRHLLYVSEENVGIWAYGAHPEAELSRQPVDLLQPFGRIQGAAGGLSVSNGLILASDPETRQLHAWQPEAEDWSHLSSWTLEGLGEPEGLSSRDATNAIQLLLRDDDDGSLRQSLLQGLPSAPSTAESLPLVQPLVATDPVPSVGDAADDPAIWLHPQHPEHSRVLGTDKRAGLAVYDLDGRQLQFLPVGRLNNVDLRSDFMLDGKLIDLAVASNRDQNSLHLFGIDRDNGVLADLGQLPSGLDDIYGLCMGRSSDSSLFVVANDKDGRFRQFRLSVQHGQIRAELSREFSVGSQPEGCVHDDQRQRLFVGEEDVAVWALDSNPAGNSELQQVIGIGQQLHADIEGLALYQHPEQPLLVISSQGNDSFLVIDAEPPYAIRGAFRIGMNAALGIDGVSETDGLEVTSANLGGPWSQGLLVVQDGRKRMPENNQNYKLVPWQRVAQILGLP